MRNTLRILLVNLSLLFLGLSGAKAQTFNGSTGSFAYSSTEKCFNVNVSGLSGNLNTTIGLARVCMNVTQFYDTDLQAYLVTPNGTRIALVLNRGGYGSNFSNTCFTMTAANSIKNGTSPFSGSYRPEGSFECVNNNTMSGNGTWKLCIRNYTAGYAGYSGTLNSWSINFGAAVGQSCGNNALAADNCANATPICTFNGYCGSTSSCYTPDEPGNLTTHFDNSCSGATIENNSWLTFTASSTTATLDVTVTNCIEDDGIQIFITSTTNCSTFTGSYLCWNPGTQVNGTLTATGLTIGQKYYVMIDGYGGDVCDYSIKATSGVQTTTAIASPSTICQGSSTTLTANAVGTGTLTYAWSTSPVQTTKSVTVSPTTSTTYTVTVNGSCGSSITATTRVTVNSAPAAPAAANQTICSGNTATLTVNPVLSGTYQWYNAASGGTFLGTGSTYVTPNLTATATYYVQNTSTLGCIGPRTAVTVTVNPTPVAPSATGTTICSGTTTTLTATAPGGTYKWYNASVGGTLLYTGAAYATPVLNATTTYYVDATSAANCTGPRTAVTVTVNTTPAAPVAPGVTICSNNSATLAVTGAGSGTYQWYNAAAGGTLLGSGTSYVTPTLTGTTTYYVQNTSPQSCIGVRTAVTVTVNARATVNAGSDATICAGFTHTLFGSRGGSSSSSIWTAPAGGTFDNASSLTAEYTPSSADIAAGKVTLKITTNDPAGPCPAAVDSLILTITPKDDASFNYSSATFCQTGSNPIPTKSGAPSTFSSTPAGLAFVSFTTGEIDVAGSTVGTYTITLNTSGACPNNSSIPVTITNAPSATFLYGSSGIFCEKDPANPIPTFPSGSSPGLFSVSPVGLVFVNTNTGQIDLTASKPGTYKIKNSISASGGCASALDSFMVTINPAAIVSAGANGALCEGDIYTLSGSMGGSATSTTWITTGTGTFGDATLLGTTYTPSVADLAKGAVTLKIISDDPAGPCNAVTDSIVITFDKPAIVSAGTDSSICEGNTFVLDGSMGGSATEINWTSASGGSFNNPSLLNATYTPSAADISSGKVTLKITSDDPSGPCNAAVDSLVITINPAPLSPVVKPSKDTICEGDSSVIMVNTPGPGITYTVYTAPNGGNVLGVTPLTVKPITSTTYYVEAKSDKGCTYLGGLVPVSIIINPAPDTPIVSVTNTPICEGDSTAINASGSGAGVKYKVYTSQTGGTYLGSTPYTVGPNVTTVYYVEAESQQGCRQLSARVPITVQVDPAPGSPQVKASNSTICQGDSVIISVDNPVSNVIYKVYTASKNGYYLGRTSLTVKPDSTTTYYVQATDTITGCSHLGALVPLTILVNKKPIAPTASGDNICSGDVAKLEAFAPPGTYQWFNAATGGTLLYTGPSYVTPSLSTTTVYYVQLISSSGCIGPRAAVQATVNPNPTPNTSLIDIATDVCNTNTGAVKGIVGADGTAPYQYLWKNAGGNPVSTSADLTKVSQGSYYLTITDTNNCTSTSGPYLVPGYQGVKASFTATPDSGSAPLLVKFTNTSTGTGPLTYLWDFGDNTGNSTVTHPSHLYKEGAGGTYQVKLIAMDVASPCKDSAFITIIVSPKSKLVIPNIFTPNGDGVNDMFKVESFGLTYIRGEIFNRWGSKMYEWDTAEGGWDGRSITGVEAPQGTYFYMIVAQGADGQNYTFQGHISLLR